MADLYTSIRGTVIKSSGSGAVLGRISPSLYGVGEILLITSIAVHRKQITQYVKTLDDKVFGYAWGEGPGSITVQGLIFMGDCGNSNGEGFGNVNSYYNINNVYRKTSPVSVSLGGAAFQGYLEEVHLNASMTEFNYGEFSLVMTIIKSGR